MQRFVLAAVAACVLFAAGLVPKRAQAMPLSIPLAVAAADTSVLQQAAYECRPIWRCGRYGCGWREVCSWTPYPRYSGAGWRHRRWHHGNY